MASAWKRLTVTARAVRVRRPPSTKWRSTTADDPTVICTSKSSQTIVRRTQNSFAGWSSRGPGKRECRRRSANETEAPTLRVRRPPSFGGLFADRGPDRVADPRVRSPGARLPPNVERALHQQRPATDHGYQSGI